MSQVNPHAGGTPAASAASASNPNQPVRNRQGGEAAGDLFSSLLSLLASTAQPGTEAGTDTPPTDTNETSATGAPQDNPLAGLLATLPGWMPVGLKAPGPDGATDAADHKGAAPTLPGRIDGATPLTAEARALLQPLEPGAARERGLEVRAERSSNNDKARPSVAAATMAVQGAQAGHGSRGVESASGLNWVRAGSIGDTPAQALAGARPTVALDERFAGATAPNWSAVARREPSADDELRPGEAAGLRSGAGAVGSEPGAGIGASGTGTGTAGDGGLGGDAGQGDAAGRNDTPREDGTPTWAAAAEETEVTHWGTGHVRHASLRVGGEGEDAIDIRLQMQGQEVQVGFATDDAQTRELLREQAPQVLGELLERSGVALGGVSVGAQGQPGQQTGSEASARSSTTERVGRSGKTDPTATPAAVPPSPRTDGSRPLDVFA